MLGDQSKSESSHGYIRRAHKTNAQCYAHNVLCTCAHARAHTHTHIDTNNAYDWDNSNFDVLTLNLSRRKLTPLHMTLGSPQWVSKTF